MIKIQNKKKRKRTNVLKAKLNTECFFLLKTTRIEH